MGIQRSNQRIVWSVFAVVLAVTLMACPPPDNDPPPEAGPETDIGSIEVFYQPGGFCVGSDATFFWADVDLSGIEGQDLGTCVVYASEEDYPDLPEIDEYRGLDAGEFGEISVGDRSAILERHVTPLPYPFFTDDILYFQEPPCLEAAPGDIAELAWPGGEDMGAFSTAIHVVDAPNLVAPPIDADQLTIDFDSDLEVVWDNAGQGARVTLRIFTHAPPEARELFCNLNDNGSFTVPRHKLTQLKHDGPFTYQFRMERDDEHFVDAPLVGGGKGEVAVTTSADIWAHGEHSDK